jgi:hypothetical protein
MAVLHGRATRAHRTFGLHMLGQPNLEYFLSYVIRTARGTHQGAPWAAGVTDRWRAMVTNLSWCSTASTVSSKGCEQLGSDQQGAVHHPQALRGVAEVQNTVERWRDLRDRS